MTMLRVTGDDGDTLDFVAPISVDAPDGPPDPPDPTEPPPLGPDPVPVTSAGKFDIQLKSEGGEFLWIARYYRLLSSGASWNDGDRDGYRAGYMFLSHPDYDAPDTHDMLARVLFIGGYGEGGATMVQDREMNEAERWYNGEKYEGDNRELNDAPRSDGYGPYDDEKDERPVIRWYDKATGTVLEKRSYEAPLSLGGDVEFRVLEHITEPFRDESAQTTDPHLVHSRITVGSTKGGVEMVNVYYDTLAEGIGMDVTITQPGAGVG